ncbi:DHH family phosphoesterase [Candidatus Woesearchaeota archaeon]|nr:DHH family phosphoesterase [Candidatus Woesearchaeota archaeon]
MKKIEQLIKIIEENKKESWAILMHEHPDPDSIGSALGLQKILASYKIKSDILYSGEISHQQNKSMINRLDIEIKPLTNQTEYTKAAMVDTTPKNAVLPKNATPIIIIDHHQQNPKKFKEAYIQIDQEAGSASTIITELIKTLKVDLEREGTKTATTLFYGIYTDTQQMLYAKKRDHEAATYLKKFADIESLDKIVNAQISPATLKIIATAINNSEIIGMHCIACAGIVKEKDALAQAADLLLKGQGIEHVIVYGIYENRVLVSTRSSTDQINAGEVVKKIWGEKFGGGRKQAAGASLEIGYFLETLPEDEQVKVISQRMKQDIKNCLKI